MSTPNDFLMLFSDEASSPRPEFISELYQKVCVAAKLPQPRISRRLSLSATIIIVATTLALLGGVLALVLLPKRDLSDPKTDSLIETVVTTTQKSTEPFVDPPTDTAPATDNVSTTPTPQTQAQPSSSTASLAPAPTTPEAALPDYTLSFWNVDASEGSPAIPATAPVYTTSAKEVNFNWGTASPHASVWPDTFVMRATRTLKLAPGTYQVTFSADDGIRMHVDETVVFDHWSDGVGSGTAFFTPDPTVPENTITIDYHELDNSAQISLSITKL